jgi:hypothetical protein
MRQTAVRNFLQVKVLVDENLQREEYTPAQRAKAISRRREIWSALHPDGIEVTDIRSPQKGARGGARRQTLDFAGDTQRATGEDRRRTNENLVWRSLRAYLPSISAHSRTKTCPSSSSTM